MNHQSEKTDGQKDAREKIMEEIAQTMDQEVAGAA
jgi:hypothetical protein